MTDLEISKPLALAIGWHKDYVYHNETAKCIQVYIEDWGHWRAFDYRDWRVIGPIAERYDCFPRKRTSTYLWWAGVGDEMPQHADTPQKALALAVIGAKT